MVLGLGWLSGWRKKQVALIVKIYTRNRNKKNAQPHAPSLLTTASTRSVVVITSAIWFTLLNRFRFSGRKYRLSVALTGTGEWRKIYNLIDISEWSSLVCTPAESQEGLLAALLLSRNVNLFKFISKETSALYIVKHFHQSTTNQHFKFQNQIRNISHFWKLIKFSCLISI